MCKLDDKFYVATTISSRPHGTYLPGLAEITLDLVNSSFKINKTVVQNTGYGYYSSQRREVNIIREDFVIADLEKFRFAVTANGITGNVYRLGYS